VLNVLAQNIPWLIGGSADLATSNKTNLKFEGAGDFQAGSYGGRNLHFGVREHVMGASVNGLTVSESARSVRRSLISATICGPAYDFRR